MTRYVDLHDLVDDPTKTLPPAGQVAGATSPIAAERSRMAEWAGFMAFYPAVALVLIAVHFWVTSGVSPFAAIRGLSVAFGIAFLPVAFGGIVLRDKDRGGVFGMLLVLGLAAGARQPLPLLPLIGGLLLLLERYGPWRLNIHWPWVGRQLRRATTIAALAVLLEAIQMGRLGDVVTSLQHETPLRSGPIGAAPPDAPDVYVILLDGYARHDLLEARFGLDDSPFLDGLRTRGFTVATANHSNYMSTLPSIASFLNYRQLVDVPALQPLIANPGIDDGPFVHRAISQAAILDRFRELGYESISLASGFEQSAVRGADRFIDGGQLNDFEIQLLRPSFVASVLLATAPDSFSASQRERIERELLAVESLSREDTARPRFVFAHIPSPHRPWVNHADGSPNVATDLDTWYFDTPETNGMSREDVIAGFTGQSAYIGGRVLRTVDAILANSARPPVILVLSDHGPALDVATDSIEVKLRNLFAAYTPGKTGMFADDVTLVNVFPAMFDAYLGVDLPRAEETINGPGPRGVFDPVPLTP